MRDVHIAIGVLAIGLNLAAGVWGARCWWYSTPSQWFWRLLRSAQLSVVLEAALGGLLYAIGKKSSSLHIVYGLLPLAVSLIAEQLRISAAQMILDARGYDSAQDVGKRPDAEQREVVMTIVRREIGVMSLAAFVIVVLLVRAATVVH